MVYLFIGESRDSVLVAKFHIVWNQYKYIFFLKRWRSWCEIFLQSRCRRQPPLSECFFNNTGRKEGGGKKKTCEWDHGKSADLLTLEIKLKEKESSSAPDNMMLVISLFSFIPIQLHEGRGSGPPASPGSPPRSCSFNDKLKVLVSSSPLREMHFKVTKMSNDG